MSGYSDAILALSPKQYYRCGDASSPLTDEITSRSATVFNTGTTFEVAGAIVGDANTAVTFSGVSDYAKPTLSYDLFGTLASWSVACWIKSTDTAGVFLDFKVGGGSARWITLEISASNEITASIGIPSGTSAAVATGLDLSAWSFVVFNWSAGATELWVNGVLEDTDNNPTYSTWPASSPLDRYIGIRADLTFAYAGSIDEIAFLPAALASGDVADLYALGTGAGSTLPMRLSGALAVAAASVPMRLRTVTTHAAASLPMYLEAPDPAHYRGSAAAWSLEVLLDDVDISDQLTGEASIEAAEDESALARLTLIPGTGSVDPDDYERKPLSLRFVGRNSAGAVLYSAKRFTGITSTATYDPDEGVITLEATTDLQGRFENLPRATIDNLIGGQWSEYVFDETADGWQYARDRLSTLASEVHVDPYGQIKVVPWAVKGTPDVTLTDAARFDNSLIVTRATRRDLITRVQATLDFRFVRLRHRQIAATLVDTYGFCHYLSYGWRLPAREAIRAAADGGAWTRVSEITFTDLPPIGTYCTPARGWTGGADDFCLGATWLAARRWAQTVTEVYTLEVVAGDLEEAIGVQTLAEDYGLEAVYDAGDYEQITTFDGPPTGAVLSAKTDDYQLDADQVEAAGRSDLAAAQAVILAKAKTTILARARKNRITVAPVYDPTITLASTVRINCPYLVATGKVAGLRETFDLASGDLVMVLELALSRHGGSGSAADDTLTAPSAPAQADEVTSSRHYFAPIRVGGIPGAVTDSDELDGWLTNAQESERTPGAALYRERLVLRLPAIEEGARNATEVAASVSYSVAVPQDELTLSN